MNRTKQFFIINLLLVITITCCFMCSNIAIAEDKTANKTVKIACDINRSLYIDSDGNINGYCYAFIEELGRINNWNIQYVSTNFNNGLEMVKNDELDIIFPLQNIGDREDYLDFSNIIGGYQPIYLYALKTDDVLFDDYECFSNSEIAVTPGGTNELALKNFAASHDFTYESVYIETSQDKNVAVKEGSARFIAASQLFEPEDFNVVAVLSYEPFYYAVKDGNSELLNELNNGMTKILSENSDLLLKVFSDTLDDSVTFANSKEEKIWLSEHEKIVVGVYKDTAPLFSVSEDGNVGIYVDVLNLIGDNAGIEIEIYPIDRTQYAYDLLGDGIIDVVLGSNDSALKNYSELYENSRAILDYTTVTVSRNNAKELNDAPIYALTAARKYWETSILKENPNASFKYYKTAKECMIAVQQKKADYTIVNAWEFNFQSKNPRFNNLIEWENQRMYSSIIMSTLNSDASNITMMSIINKGILCLSESEKNEIVTMNLNRQQDSITISDYLYIFRTIIILITVLIAVLIAGFVTYYLTRKKYVDQLVHNNEELEKVNLAKSKFLSRMSHDIRTPMNAILGMSNLALNNDNPPDTVDCLNKINLAGDFLLGLVNDVLDIQRIDSGRIVLNLTPYSSEEFAKYVDALIKPMFDRKHINFNYQYIGNGSFVIMQDRLKTNQVYFNILSNASKYTPEGGTVSFVTEETETADRVNLKVTISDNGIGMTEEFQKKLFMPFAQESETTTSSGSGLGLAIVKRLCDMMNIDIKVESKKGVGTKFILLSSYDKATLEQINGNVVKNVEHIDVDAILNGKNILVCEDQPLNQEIIKRQLKMKNVNVVLANDGKIGVDLFGKSAVNSFDVVIMDLRMPNMNGLDACKNIRAMDREDAKSIPIIALSANAYEEDIKSCIDAGMDTHLAKPINPTLLYDTIAKQIVRKKN